MKTKIANLVMTRKAGKKKGHGTNSSSPWGTGGSLLDASPTSPLPWNPDTDFVPAWISLEQLTSSELPLDTELPEGQFQRYLPFYINNDGVQDSVDVLILETGEDTSVGFGQETYILKESWDSTPGNVESFGTGGVLGPYYPRSFPNTADLGKMFLVNGTSKPFETPKLTAGGRFSETAIVIEDAQSTTPPVKLDDNDNTYIVTTVDNSKLSGGTRPSVDAVYGKGGDDQIVGSNAGRNHLLGEAGNDVLQGGLGEQDILNGGSGNDNVYGGKGDDLLFGSMGDDVLWGDYEENYRSGSDLNGNPKDFVFDRDTLYGGTGNDALFGGAGADLLFGGDGIDYLSPGKKGTSSHPQYALGGAGADRFDFYTDPWLSGINLDITSGKEFMERMILADFDASEGDKIGIYVGTKYDSSFTGYYDGLPENVVNAPISADLFRAGTEALDQNDRFIYHNTSFSNGVFYGDLYFDKDGTGSIYPKAFLANIYSSSPLTYRDIVTFNDSNRLPPASTTLPSIPSIQFSQSTYQVNENAGSATITLSRSGSAKGRSQVQLNITGGTATGVDYSSDFPLTVTFDINETSKTISIPIIQDALVEETESIEFSITAVDDPTAGTVETALGAVRTTTLAISDDDIPVSSKENKQPSNNSDNKIPDNTIEISGNTIESFENDVIITGGSNNTLRGYAGDDLLKSGKGNDRLTGGTGKDIFVLEKGKGRDTIQDFEDKQDRLGLMAGMKFKRLEITQQGKNALISLGRDELALLRGVRLGQLSAADFTTAFNLDIRQ